jgi:hypothetical protein
MPRKKGKPHAEGELKKTISASVTPTAHTELKRLATEWGFVSFSAMLEDLGQRRIFLAQSQQSSHPVSLSSQEAETIRQILDSMAPLTPALLAEVVTRAGDLISQKLERPMCTSRTDKTIAEWVQECRSACVVMFEDIFPIERVDAIATGAKPTDEELEVLASALPISLEDLRRMRKEEFPNGSASQGCTRHH